MPRRGRRPAGLHHDANGALTAAAPDGGGDFVLTLRGEGIETPIVDVTITFPATAPAVIIAGARFDGTLYPETNGITATVTPRRNGDVTLAADWGGHPFLYEVELREQGGPGSVVLADQGPATRMAETLAGHRPQPLDGGPAERRGRLRTHGDGRDDRLALTGAGAGRGAGPVPSATGGRRDRTIVAGAPGPPIHGAPTRRTAV